MEHVNDLIPVVEKMQENLKELREQTKKLDEHISSLETQVSEMMEKKEPEEKEAQSKRVATPVYHGGRQVYRGSRVLEFKDSGRTIDPETSNHSFRIFSERLRSSGIKNWYFPLLLNDPSIVYWNPGFQSYDTHEAGKIIKECSENIWYFLREVLKFNPASMIMGEYGDFTTAMKEAFLFTKGINVFIEDNSPIPKRMLYGIMIWLLLFKPQTIAANIFTDESDRNQEFLRLVHGLPKYLMPKNDTVFSGLMEMDGYIGPKGSISQTNYRNSEIVSMFSIFDIDEIDLYKAENLFRGYRCNTFSMINPTKQDQISGRIFGSLNVTRSVIEDDKKYPIIIIDETDDNGLFCNLSIDIKRDGVSWDDNFFDMDEESLKKFIGDKFVCI